MNLSRTVCGKEKVLFYGCSSKRMYCFHSQKVGMKHENIFYGNWIRRYNTRLAQPARKRFSVRPEIKGLANVYDPYLPGIHSVGWWEGMKLSMVRMRTMFRLRRHEGVFVFKKKELLQEFEKLYGGFLNCTRKKDALKYCTRAFVGRLRKKWRNDRLKVENMTVMHGNIAVVALPSKETMSVIQVVCKCEEVKGSKRTIAYPVFERLLNEDDSEWKITGAIDPDVVYRKASKEELMSNHLQQETL